MTCRWIIAGALAVGLAGCAGKTHQSAQAGPTDTSRAQVLQMPSGFRNVAIKCAIIQGNRVIVASLSRGGSGDNKTGAVAIAPGPNCTHDGP